MHRVRCSLICSQPLQDISMFYSALFIFSREKITRSGQSKQNRLLCPRICCTAASHAINSVGFQDLYCSVCPVAEEVGRLLLMCFYATQYWLLYSFYKFIYRETRQTSNDCQHLLTRDCYLSSKKKVGANHENISTYHLFLSKKKDVLVFWKVSYSGWLMTGELNPAPPVVRWKGTLKNIGAQNIKCNSFMKTDSRRQTAPVTGNDSGFSVAIRNCRLQDKRDSWKIMLLLPMRRRDTKVAMINVNFTFSLLSEHFKCSPQRMRRRVVCGMNCVQSNKETIQRRLSPWLLIDTWYKEGCDLSGMEKPARLQPNGGESVCHYLWRDMKAGRQACKAVETLSQWGWRSTSDSSLIVIQEGGGVTGHTVHYIILVMSEGRKESSLREKLFCLAW